MSTPRPRDKLRIITAYYAVRALHILAHAAYFTVFVLYIQRLLPNPHLAAQWFLVTLAVSFAAEALFEVVTGAFADRHGRTKSVALYAVCYLFSSCLLVIPIVFPHSGDEAQSLSVTILIVSTLGFTLGASFLSGALEAWLVDSLAFYHSEVNLAQVLARGSLIHNVAWLAGGSLGLALFDLSAPLPWLLIICLMLLVILTAVLMMPEPYMTLRQDSQSLGPGWWQVVREAWSSIRDDRDVGRLTWAFGGGYILWVPLGYLWVAVYRNLAAAALSAGTPVIDDKIAFLIVGLARVLGSSLSELWSRVGSNKKLALLLGTALNTAPLLAVLLLPLGDSKRVVAIGFIVIVFASKLGEEAVKPLRLALVNNAIDRPEARATILSFSTFAGAVLAGLLSLALSFLGRGVKNPVGLYLGILAVVGVLSGAISSYMYAGVRERANHADN